MNITLLIGSLGLIVGSLALAGAFASLVIVIGIKNSTHKIEWKPIPVEAEGNAAELEKMLSNIEDEYAYDEV